jgi:hypothetical protein
MVAADAAMQPSATRMAAAGADKAHCLDMRTEWAAEMFRAG